MVRAFRLSAVLTIVLGAVLVTVGQGQRASACSCDLVDPIDAIAMADAVFFGVPVEEVPVGGIEDHLDGWRFDVDGVIKGDVAAEEVVLGDNEGSSCGPMFQRGMGSLVVFATDRPDGYFQKWACVGADPATLVARLDEPVAHRGTGPPAAVRVGSVGRTDIAVIDAAGRSLGAALLGVADNAASGATACPGTTNVSLVSAGGQTHVTVVDLAGWTVVAEFAFRVATQPDTAVACYDHGERIAVTNRDDGFLRVFTAITMGESFSYEAPSFMYEAGTDYASAVFHPAGTALLLPAAGGGLRAIDVRDFELPPLADIALPAGASVGRGAISPDGSRLAMLATLDGTPSVGRTPNTHVIVVDLVDGVPVDGSVATVALDPESAAWPDGPALRITWVDDATWAIEHVGNVEDWVEFIGTDGAQLLPPTDIGIGGELVPVSGGIVRQQLSGVQAVALDGAVTLGDPEPDESFDRRLVVGNLRGLVEFTPTDASPPAYEVSPPKTDVGPPAVSTVAPPEISDFPAVTAAPGLDATDDGPPVGLVLAVALVAGIVLLIAAAWLLKRACRDATPSNG